MIGGDGIQTKADMADMLERFFEWAPAGEHATGWEWDDFEHCRFPEPPLEAWRQRILREIGHLVAPSRGAYSDRIADDRARQLIASLRRGDDA